MEHGDSAVSPNKTNSLIESEELLDKINTPTKPENQSHNADAKKACNDTPTLSKIAQPNNGGANNGWRVPMALSGAGIAASNSISRLPQSAGSSGRSKIQNSTAGKKNESNIHNGSYEAIKTSSNIQQQSTSAYSTASKASFSSLSQYDEKSPNGVSKSANTNQKPPQNGISRTTAKDRQKEKDKRTEKIESYKVATKDEVKPSKNKSKATAGPSVDAKKILAVADENIDSEVVGVAKTTTTPTSDRKCLRRVAANQQKSLTKPKQSDLPEDAVDVPANLENPVVVVKSVIVDNPSAIAIHKPAAVDKPVAVPSQAIDELEMEILSVEASPIKRLACVEPVATSTPGCNLFGFRSSSNRQLSSSLAETPNSSSFSLSLFGRGRKRERTPTPSPSIKSDNDLDQEVEMSPPKRARFDLLKPFTKLRSRFSKTPISFPDSCQREDEILPTGSNEITVGQQACLETGNKSSTTVDGEVQDDIILNDQGVDAVANLPAADDLVPVEGDGEDHNRSRCAIM